MKTIQKILLASLHFYSIHLASTETQDSGAHAPVSYYYLMHSYQIFKMIDATHALPPRPVIVDAGAFDGTDSVALASYWREGIVHSFEPVSQIYKKLTRKTKYQSNIHTYQCALGELCGRRTIYLSHHREDSEHVSMSSSLYLPKDHLIYSDVLFQGEEVVDVITLDVWAERQGISKVDMLWLDMQGYELAALKASPKILKGISVIFIELEFVEAYKGQPLYEEVRAWLEKEGFALIAGDFAFPKNPKQWFGNGLFIRREFLISE